MFRPLLAFPILLFGMLMALIDYLRIKQLENREKRKARIAELSTNTTGQKK